MAEDAAERLVVVARGWERLAAEKDVEIARLKAENLRLFALVPEQTYDDLNADDARLRALVSWIYGMCVEEADHMEIRAPIDRYWKSAK